MSPCSRPARSRACRASAGRRQVNGRRSCLLWCMGKAATSSDAWARQQPPLVHGQGSNLLWCRARQQPPLVHGQGSNLLCCMGKAATSSGAWARQQPPR
eukprot:314632-Chlamydomonas_euryale.AAC.1